MKDYTGFIISTVSSEVQRINKFESICFYRITKATCRVSIIRLTVHAGVVFGYNGIEYKGLGHG